MVFGSRQRLQTAGVRLAAAGLGLLFAGVACGRGGSTAAPADPTLPALSSPTPGTDPEPSTVPATPTLAPTRTPAIQANRVAIRTLEGVAEFYDTATGERFVPRGVNYVDFYRTE